jgi:hypothetical protein
MGEKLLVFGLIGLIGSGALYFTNLNDSDIAYSLHNIFMVTMISGGLLSIFGSLIVLKLYIRDTQ